MRVVVYFFLDTIIILKEILAFCWLAHVHYSLVVCFVFRLYFYPLLFVH